MFRKKPKFYKGTLTLLILILFLSVIVFPSKLALAQEVNYCTQPGAVPELNILSSTLQWGGWWSTASNINDDNESTYAGCYWQSKGSRRAIEFRYETIVEFTQPASQITRVEYRRSGGNSGNSYAEFLRTGPPPRGTLSTYLWYNNQWNEIHSREMFVQVGWRYYLPLATEVIRGNWSNVSKVKIEAHHSVFRWSLNYIGNSKIYEIRAFGPSPPAYQDIGLRVYNGTETITIAIEPTGTLTSPLRIAKNGVIYGIALVEPGDSNDSGVRIQTSSGIKALRRL